MLKPDWIQRQMVKVEKQAPARPLWLRQRFVPNVAIDSPSAVESAR